MRLLAFLVAVPSAVVAASTLVVIDQQGAPTLLTSAITVVVFYVTAYGLAVPVGITAGLLRSRRAARRG